MSSGLVEMVRNAAEPHGRDHFACPPGVWDLLQELGQTFGWQPKGTTYAVRPNHKDVMDPARHDYRPGDALDRKRLDEDDAVAWARALQTAKESVQFDALLAHHLARHTAVVESQIPVVKSLIFEFTEFAYGGEFTFASSGLREPEH